MNRFNWCNCRSLVFGLNRINCVENIFEEIIIFDTVKYRGETLYFNFSFPKCIKFYSLYFDRQLPCWLNTKPGGHGERGRLPTRKRGTLILVSFSLRVSPVAKTVMSSRRKTTPDIILEFIITCKNKTTYFTVKSKNHMIHKAQANLLPVTTAASTPHPAVTRLAFRFVYCVVRPVQVQNVLSVHLA